MALLTLFTKINVQIKVQLNWGLFRTQCCWRTAELCLNNQPMQFSWSQYSLLVFCFTIMKFNWWYLTSYITNLTNSIQTRHVIHVSIFYHTITSNIFRHKYFKMFTTKVRKCIAVCRVERVVMSLKEWNNRKLYN